VQLLPNLETGGAEKMVVQLSLELRSAGIPTGVVSLFDGNGSQLERKLRSEKIPLWFLGKHLGPDLPMIARLRKLLGKLRPQVIHTHLGALRYAVPSVIGLDTSKTIVHTIHRVAERDSGFGLRWIQRWCLSRGVRLVAVSEEVAKSCARVYRLPNVPVIPNGIALPKLRNAPETRCRVRRILGIAGGAFVFCCVARFRPVKNHRALLEAFAGQPHLAGAHLLLAGDGQLRQEMEALARQLQIDRQVHFLGEREDVSELLAASDAFALASLSEGNPLSVQEAMAAGLPILATAVGGLPELVRNETDGLLVPSGNVSALRDAMMRMICDTDFRTRMSRASEQTANSRFDSNVMARCYVSIYEERSAVFAARRE
jgi:glycosyltransferase involved in cell wall biosynthesis